MAPFNKKAKVENHILSDSEEDDFSDGAQASTSKVEVISNFTRTKGKLTKNDTEIKVAVSPRKPRWAPTPADPPSASSAQQQAPKVQHAHSKHVADTAAWLNLLDLNSQPWDPTDSEKARHSESSSAQGRDGAAGGEKGGEKKKRKRTSSDNPLLEFVAMMDVFLDEMLRREGPAGCLDKPECLRCGHVLDLAFGECAPVGKRAVRCRDCRSDSIWCEQCVVEDHRRMYLHRIEVWNGSHFERITLKSLGLRVQLGHPVGESCQRKLAAFDDAFLVIDSDGCHPIGLDFCECQAADPVEQLLREGLFPATTVDPRTAATFRVLETFQMLSFTGCISAYEFLVAIWRRTNNSWNVVQRKASKREKMPDLDGKVPFYERQSEWMRIVHEWRVLRLLKRFARGYDPNGIETTEEGACSVECPACPHPGVNMPKWENIPRAKRWLYALFLAIDANFRLRRKDVSSDERDPGLIKGFAYFVADPAFRQFLDDPERKDAPVVESTCSNYDAIKSANIRGGPGVAASGVGGVVCARHDFRRPTSAGDLQKGERYINMDYIFLKGLRAPLPKKIIVSYDIGCQWEIHMFSRCDSYDFGVLKGDHGYDITVLVPKFHLPAHKGPCVITHSFNLEPGVGRTDGEAPERGWARSNKLAASTREMGPGNRRDTIDDWWGDKNWEKFVEMPDTLADRAAVAIPKRDLHTSGFLEFAGGLEPEQQEEFTELVKEFEADKMNENPYLNENCVLEPKDIKAKLKKEDEEAVKRREPGIVQRNVHISSFIIHGVEIQEAQQKYELDVRDLGAGAGMAERTKIAERGVALRARIDGWIAVQAHFAPRAIAVRATKSEASANEEDETSPWTIPTCLPSDPDAVDCYDHRATRHEFRYRVSEAERALNDLRSALIYDAHMQLSKKKYASGTEQTTRSVKILKDMSERVRREVSRYRSMRGHLIRLWPRLQGAEDMKDHKDWMNVLQPLEDKDITGPTSLDDDRIGEGGKILTWIWTASGTGKNAKAVALAALRVEFCRARARAHRCQEECLLLAEEMRRTERYYQADISRWEQRAKDAAVTLTTPINTELPKNLVEEIREQRKITAGKVAFAWRQAALRRVLHQKAMDTHQTWSKSLQSSPKLVECVE